MSGSPSSAAVRVAMDPRVRDLYRRCVVVGRDYPAGLDAVRQQAKKAMRAEKDRKSVV